jgi:hypothetical protein
MAQHKKQHYVPRCYLKSFSSDAEGKTINLYNITNSTTVRKAPIKGQCAKNYLYGEDLALEKSLQIIKGYYASIIKKLNQNDILLTEDNLQTLLTFAYLQFSRTEKAAHRRKSITEGFHRHSYEGASISKPEIDLSDRTMTLSSMRTFTKTIKYCEDLKVVIIKNETKLDFITSDDPTILTNKFLLQKMKIKTFGLASSGTLLLLPLTPKFLLFCYDKDVYTIHNIKNNIISTKKISDINAFNQFQYLKADKNLYFLNWEQHSLIAQQFSLIISRRPKTTEQFNIFRQDKTFNNKVRYREKITSDNSASKLIVVTPTQLEPLSWPSILKFRDPPITYSNGSAAGYVRKSIWLSKTNNTFN